MRLCGRFGKPSQDANVPQRVFANRDRTLSRPDFLRLVDPHVGDDSSLKASLTSDTYSLLPEYSTMQVMEAEQRARAAAQKAVDLDPNLAEAHTSLAFAEFWGSLDAADADREFRRAIELDPKLSRAHHWHATFLNAVLRTQDVLAEIERARQLDPSSKAILADKGVLLLDAGRRDEARILLKQMEASDPNFRSSH